MHLTLTAALPGDLPAEHLRDALNKLMDRFDENREVEPHRDQSVYAEPFDAQLAKAKAYAQTCVERGQPDHTAGLSDAEIVKDWEGVENFDDDGWPLITANPDGKWDWWVIGGRWGGAWTLKGGAEDGPLNTEEHAFGRTDRADEPGRTDNARWSSIAPESVAPTYSWIDLDGVWHDKWIGPTREEALGTSPKNPQHWTRPDSEHAADFLKFLADLPPDTWLVQIDYHQ